MHTFLFWRSTQFVHAKISLYDNMVGSFLLDIVNIYLFSCCGHHPKETLLASLIER